MAIMRSPGAIGIFAPRGGAGRSRARGDGERARGRQGDAGRRARRHCRRLAAERERASAKAGRRQRAVGLGAGPISLLPRSATTRWLPDRRPGQSRRENVRHRSQASRRRRGAAPVAHLLLPSRRPARRVAVGRAGPPQVRGASAAGKGRSRQRGSTGAEPSGSISRRRVRRICGSATTGPSARPHFSGAFPNAILQRLSETRCVEPRDIPRALRLTRKGRAFFDRLGVAIPF